MCVFWADRLPGTKLKDFRKRRVSIELQLHVQHEADGPALELLPVADGIGKAVEGREGPSSPKRPRQSR